MVRKEFLMLFAKHIRMSKRGYIRDRVTEAITYRFGCPFSNRNTVPEDQGEWAYENLLHNRSFLAASSYYLNFYASEKLRKQMLAVINRVWKKKKKRRN